MDQQDDMDGLVGWMEGLDALCMKCVHIPCICLLRLIEDRVRELEGSKDGGGTREPGGECPASPQRLDLRRMDGGEQLVPQVGRQEGGENLSMKQGTSPASPPGGELPGGELPTPPEAREENGGTAATDQGGEGQSQGGTAAGRAGQTLQVGSQEGGDKLSMRQEIHPASPPVRIGQEGGGRTSTRQSTPSVSPPGKMKKEGGESFSMERGVSSASPPQEPNLDKEGGDEISMEQRPSKAPPPNGLDQGGEEEGSQPEIDNGEGVPAAEQADDKVKLRKPANPVQGEPAEQDGGEARDGEGDLGGLLEDEGLTSRKKGSFIPQEPAGNPDPDQQTTSKEEQRKEWKRMMESSRKRQEEVEEEERNMKEASKKKRKRKVTAEKGGRGVSDIMNFWKRKESQSGEQELTMTRKRKVQEHQSGEGVPDRKRRLWEITGTAVDGVKSETFKKLKFKTNFSDPSSSSSRLGVGGVGDDHDAVLVPDLVGGKGRGAALHRRAEKSALQTRLSRPDYAADEEQN